jgi:hypothetical protein
MTATANCQPDSGESFDRRLKRVQHKEKNTFKYTLGNLAATLEVQYVLGTEHHKYLDDSDASFIKVSEEALTDYNKRISEAHERIVTELACEIANKIF